MDNKITNLVFEGGGMLGVGYVGALEYLYEKGIIKNIKRVAGTSMGAITSCVLSFNVDFEEIKRVTNTINFKKVIFGNDNKKKTNKLKCLWRLLNNYGLLSSKYFYIWIKDLIAEQFDQNLKQPPYTFADFKNTEIHKNKKPFLDLYIIGSDITNTTQTIFSYETTPDMEVAEAVRISISIPLLFEAVIIEEEGSKKVFSDGGVTKNYPINIFDDIDYDNNLTYTPNFETLGLKFKSRTVCYRKTDNILQYLTNLAITANSVQNDIYNTRYFDKKRTIEIDTKGVSPTNFDIKQNDETYNFLYKQGYEAAKNYFENKQ